MRFYLVLLCIGAASVLSLGSVTFASCLFLWNDIFQPLPFARYPDAFPIAKYVLAVLLGSYALGLARGKFKPRANFLILYSPFLFLWILITAVKSPIPGSVDGFVAILKYLLPLLLISSAIRTVKDVKLLSVVLALSVAVWSAQAGIHGLIKGQSKDMSIPGGQMTDNNDFMAATVSILPMLIFLSFSYQGRFKPAAKIFGIIATVLSLAAVVFSNSRGAALGVVSCALLYVVFVARRKIRDGFVIVTVVGGTLFLLPQSFWDRMNTINIGVEQTEGSAAERIHMMTSAFHAVLDKPIFGVGPDCWLEVAVFYSGLRLDPHNFILKLSAEIGIPGLLLYLTIPVVLIRKLYGIRRRAMALKDKENANLATTLIMVIVGFLLPSIFLSHPFSEFLWGWFGISSAYVVIYYEGIQRLRANAKASLLKRARKSLGDRKGLDEEGKDQGSAHPA